MKAFRYPLQGVLGWKQMEWEREQERLAALGKTKAELQAELAAAVAQDYLERSWAQEQAVVDGGDLSALARRTAYGNGRRKRMEQELVLLNQQIDAQRSCYLEAKRAYELHNRLRSRALSRWQMEYKLEVEAQAAESHLAKWVRERESD